MRIIHWRSSLAPFVAQRWCSLGAAEGLQFSLVICSSSQGIDFLYTSCLHGMLVHCSSKNYSYEVWQNAEKVYWYDPQPHPDDPHLAITHPHHKHVLPNIKHNRFPAPGLRFDEPNLPLLIEEIEQNLR